MFQAPEALCRIWQKPGPLHSGKSLAPHTSNDSFREARWDEGLFVGGVAFNAEISYALELPAAGGDGVGHGRFNKALDHIE